MHIIQPYRPLQVGFNSRVLEQNRRFYLVVSATLGIHLESGKVMLDVDFLKDAFQAMGDKPTPEFGLPKPRAEFIISGSFFSPPGKPVAAGEVKVRLADKEKSLYVFGPRKWGPGNIPTAPAPVSSVAIDYANSFGGPDYDKNVAGIGFNDKQLPLIENPEQLIASPDERPEPAGFSPLALDCPQRMCFKGTYGDDYKNKYFPGHPEDFDWHYFLNTPEDQWFDTFLTGTEPFEIYNMHPEKPLIKGVLPGVYPRAFIRHTITNETPEFTELDLNLDTIWFFPEALLGMLVFRNVIEVADDEATQVSDILLAYEQKDQDPRTVEHYRQALEKRMTGDNPFSNYFQTPDLIPQGAMTALALFQEKGEVQLEESALSQNITARAKAAETMVDEKIAEAAKSIPSDGVDLKKSIKEAQEAVPQPDDDVKEFTDKLEDIMPGITTGNAGRLNLDAFPFDRIGDIADAARQLGQKKEKQARDKISKEVEKVKKQLADSDADTSDTLLPDFEKQLADLAGTDSPRIEKSPLPRLNVEQIMAQMPKNLPADVVEAIQHIEGLKALNAEKKAVESMEKEVKGRMIDIEKTVKAPLLELETQFKTGYFLSAHFMDEGLSPHGEDINIVKQRFLDDFEQGRSLAGRDWACLDLSGMVLDNVDLSGAFLEQVNFSNASLKGANLSGAILARANLCGANLFGANLSGANIGAVNGHQANFSNASLTQSKLSKGNFSKACFAQADLEGAETLNLIIDYADFSRANLPGTMFLETRIKGACFKGAMLSTSFFMMSTLEDVDFTGAQMNRCLFANAFLENVCFDNVELNASCFAGTDTEQTRLKNLSFRQASLKKSNFQRMILEHAVFTKAQLENAYFESADLTGADFTGAQARFTQFRNATLDDACLDHINLKEGSLAKAHIVGTSLKRANLFQADVLRATITNADFTAANLDDTLIEHWRPE